jgi:hypothetical protein
MAADRGFPTIGSRTGGLGLGQARRREVDRSPLSFPKGRANLTFDGDTMRGPGKGTGEGGRERRKASG